MTKSDVDLRKWLKEKFPYVEKSDEQIKKEFIESFGVEKWEEEEALSPLIDLSYKLCDYLGIEPVPIVFEEMGEDARYYDELNYIAISSEFIKDSLECKKSVIHEIKHLHQKNAITSKDSSLIFAPKNLIKEWEIDFKVNQRLLTVNEIMCLSVEVDAFAFTKFILKEWFDYEYHHNDKTYDFLLDIYVKKYFK